jgi:hypothetical protein
MAAVLPAKGRTGQRSRYPDTARIARSEAISNTELVLRKIDQRWPRAYQSVMRFRVHQSSVSWTFPVQLKQASQSQR